MSSSQVPSKRKFVNEDEGHATNDPRKIPRYSPLEDESIKASLHTCKSVTQSTDDGSGRCSPACETDVNSLERSEPDGCTLIRCIKCEPVSPPPSTSLSNQRPVTTATCSRDSLNINATSVNLSHLTSGNGSSHVSKESGPSVRFGNSSQYSQSGQKIKGSCYSNTVCLNIKSERFSPDEAHSGSLPHLACSARNLARASSPFHALPQQTVTSHSAETVSDLMRTANVTTGPYYRSQSPHIFGSPYDVYNIRISSFKPDSPVHSPTGQHSPHAHQHGGRATPVDMSDKSLNCEQTKEQNSLDTPLDLTVSKQISQSESTDHLTSSDSTCSISPTDTPEVVLDLRVHKRKHTKDISVTSPVRKDICTGSQSVNQSLIEGKLSTENTILQNTHVSSATLNDTSVQNSNIASEILSQENQLKTSVSDVEIIKMSDTSQATCNSKTEIQEETHDITSLLTNMDKNMEDDDATGSLPTKIWLVRGSNPNWTHNVPVSTNTLTTAAQQIQSEEVCDLQQDKQSDHLNMQDSCEVAIDDSEKIRQRLSNYENTEDDSAITVISQNIKPFIDVYVDENMDVNDDVCVNSQTCQIPTIQTCSVTGDNSDQNDNVPPFSTSTCTPSTLSMNIIVKSEKGHRPSYRHTFSRKSPKSETRRTKDERGVKLCRRTAAQSMLRMAISHTMKRKQQQESWDRSETKMHTTKRFEASLAISNASESRNTKFSTVRRKSSHSSSQRNYPPKHRHTKNVPKTNKLNKLDHQPKSCTQANQQSSKKTNQYKCNPSARPPEKHNLKADKRQRRQQVHKHNSHDISEILIDAEMSPVKYDGVIGLNTSRHGKAGLAICTNVEQTTLKLINPCTNLHGLADSESKTRPSAVTVTSENVSHIHDNIPITHTVTKHIMEAKDRIDMLSISEIAITQTTATLGTTSVQSVSDNSRRPGTVDQANDMMQSLDVAHELSYFETSSMHGVPCPERVSNVPCNPGTSIDAVNNANITERTSTCSLRVEPVSVSSPYSENIASYSAAQSPKDTEVMCEENDADNLNPGTSHASTSSDLANGLISDQPDKYDVESSSSVGELDVADPGMPGAGSDEITDMTQTTKTIGDILQNVDPLTVTETCDSVSLQTDVTMKTGGSANRELTEHTLLDGGPFAARNINNSNGLEELRENLNNNAVALSDEQQECTAGRSTDLYADDAHDYNHLQPSDTCYPSTPTKTSDASAHKIMLTPQKSSDDLAGDLALELISQQLNILNQDSGQLSTVIHKSESQHREREKRAEEVIQAQRNTANTTARKLILKATRCQFRKHHLGSPSKRPLPRLSHPDDADSTESDEPLQIATDTDTDFDSRMDENADSHNLTAVNVRNILREVLTNQHVLAMVQNTVNDKAVDDTDFIASVFEPKMTRSKVKQAIEEGNLPKPWPLTPVKKPLLPAPTIMDVSWTEDEEESDIDYAPIDREVHESDEDSESVTSSFRSENGSPRTMPTTPITPSTPIMQRVTPLQNTDSQELFSPGSMGPPPSVPSISHAKALGQKYKDAVDALEEAINEDEQSTVATRTRSKVQLCDTSLTELEALFTAPDITPDMYGPESDDKEEQSGVDKVDNQEWTDFLGMLYAGGDLEDCPDTLDDEDPEFNFLAELDKMDKIDMEDLRDDKSVKITKKEVSQLMDELIEAYEDSEVWDVTGAKMYKSGRYSTSAHVTKLVEVTTCISESQEMLCVTQDQRPLLAEQMRKHVQLLTQNYVLCLSRPALERNLHDSKAYLEELHHLSQLCSGPETMFNVCNLASAVELVKHADPHEELNECSHLYKRNRTISDMLPKLTYRQQKLMWNCTALIYPKLLPQGAYHYPDLIPKHINKLFFTLAEDYLIALGMEQTRGMCQSRGDTKKQGHLIHHYMMKCKSSKQIRLRIKNQSAKNSKDNPIKYCKKNRILPDLSSFRVVSILYESDVQGPKCQDMNVLPDWCKVFEDFEQEWQELRDPICQRTRSKSIGEPDEICLKKGRNKQAKRPTKSEPSSTSESEDGMTADNNDDDDMMSRQDMNDNLLAEQTSLTSLVDKALENRERKTATPHLIPVGILMRSEDDVQTLTLVPIESEPHHQPHTINRANQSIVITNGEDLTETVHDLLDSSFSPEAPHDSSIAEHQHSMSTGQLSDRAVITQELVEVSHDNSGRVTPVSSSVVSADITSYVSTALDSHNLAHHKEEKPADILSQPVTKSVAEFIASIASYLSPQECHRSRRSKAVNPRQATVMKPSGLLAEKHSTGISHIARQKMTKNRYCGRANRAILPKVVPIYSSSIRAATRVAKCARKRRVHTTFDLSKRWTKGKSALRKLLPKMNGTATLCLQFKHMQNHCSSKESEHESVADDIDDEDDIIDDVDTGVDDEEEEEDDEDDDVDKEADDESAKSSDDNDQAEDPSDVDIATMADAETDAMVDLEMDADEGMDDIGDDKLESDMESEIEDANLPDGGAQYDSQNEGLYDSQNEAMYDSQVDEDADDEDHLAELMAASTTIRFAPKKQSLAIKRSKAQRKREEDLVMLAPDIVERDTMRDDRDTAFAQAYLSKVKDLLKKESPAHYTQFLRTLCDFEKSKTSPVKLYHDMCELLKDYPDLIPDFAGFLLPEQAVECGCFLNNKAFYMARTFLRKLEVHFEKQPSHFQRIIRTFAKWNSRSHKSVHELHDQLQPMFRGQQHLLEEFSLFFEEERPPDSHMTDYEEITLGDSDEDTAQYLDGFEEVAIPEEHNVYGTKKCPCQCHCLNCDIALLKRKNHCKACGLKVIDGKLYFLTSGKLRPAKVLYYKPFQMGYGEDRVSHLRHSPASEMIANSSERNSYLSSNHSPDYTSSCFQPIGTTSPPDLITNDTAGRQNLITYLNVSSPVKRHTVPSDLSPCRYNRSTFSTRNFSANTQTVSSLKIPAFSVTINDSTSTHRASYSPSDARSPMNSPRMNRRRIVPTQIAPLEDCTGRSSKKCMRRVQFTTLSLNPSAGRFVQLGELPSPEKSKPCMMFSPCKDSSSEAGDLLSRAIRAANVNLSDYDQSCDTHQFPDYYYSATSPNVSPSDRALQDKLGMTPVKALPHVPGSPSLFSHVTGTPSPVFSTRTEQASPTSSSENILHQSILHGTKTDTHSPIHDFGSNRLGSPPLTSTVKRNLIPQHNIDRDKSSPPALNLSDSLSPRNNVETIVSSASRTEKTFHSLANNASDVTSFLLNSACQHPSGSLGEIVMQIPSVTTSITSASTIPSPTLAIHCTVTNSPSLTSTSTCTRNFSSPVDNCNSPLRDTSQSNQLPSTESASDTKILSPVGTLCNTKVLSPVGTVSDIRTLSRIGTMSDTRTLSPVGTNSDARTLSPVGTMSSTRSLSPVGTISDTRLLSPVGTVSDIRILSPVGTVFDTKTLSPIGTMSNTRSLSPVGTVSNTRILSPVGTMSNTRSLSPVENMSETRILSPVGTMSETRILSPVETVSDTRTLSPVGTMSETRILSPVGTMSETRILSPVETMSETRILSPVGTVSDTRTLSPVGTMSNTRSLSPVENMSETRILSPVGTMSETRILSPVGTVSDTRTLSHVGTMSNTRSLSPIANMSETRILSPVGTLSDIITLSPVGTTSNIRSLSPVGPISDTRTLSAVGTVSDTKILSPIGTVSHVAIVSDARILSPVGSMSDARILSPVRTVSDMITLSPVGTVSDTKTLSPTGIVSDARILSPVGNPSTTQSLSPVGTRSDTRTLSPVGMVSDTRTLSPIGTVSDERILSPIGMMPDARILSSPVGTMCNASLSPIETWSDTKLSPIGISDSRLFSPVRTVSDTKTLSPVGTLSRTRILSPVGTLSDTVCDITTEQVEDEVMAIEGVTTMDVSLVASSSNETDVTSGCNVSKNDSHELSGMECTDPHPTWNMEMDRVLLEACKAEGPTPETFAKIAEQFGIVDTEQVCERFTHLISLFSSTSTDHEEESMADEDED